MDAPSKSAFSIRSLYGVAFPFCALDSAISLASPSPKLEHNRLKQK
jgi:hypothetical protein